MRKRSVISSIVRVSVPAKFFLGAVALACFCFASCKKDTNAGIGVQPTGDLLNVKVSDTTTMVTWVLKEDSLQTSQALSQYVFGNYWDPIFGKTNASIYTQFTFPTNDVNLDFASGGNELLLTCDSLVLCLGYETSYYGDTTLPHTIRVYQMANSMGVNTPYKSDTAFPCFPTPVGSKTFQPAPNTSVKIWGKPRGTQIRVPLDKSLGQLILNNSGKPALASNSTFVQLLKGLYIHDETPLNNRGDGCMLYLPLSDTLTHLTLYYKNANLPPAQGDSLAFNFSIDLNAARFARFDHDYKTADPLIQSDTAQAKKSTHPSQKEIFVSSLAGLKTKVEFPYIQNWIKNGMIAINRAELTIKAVPSPPGSNPNYQPVQRLMLLNIDSLGHEVLPVDYNEGSDYFGGYLDAVNNQYVFHLDRYLQQILTGKQKNNGLYLIAVSSASYANRVVLGGANNTSGFKMNLRLSYTKLH